MKIPKRYIGFRIPTSLYETIERTAANEGRTFTNTCEVLLEWAVAQLDRADNTIALKSWTAVSREDLLAFQQPNPTQSRRAR